MVEGKKDGYSIESFIIVDHHNNIVIVFPFRAFLHTLFTLASFFYVYDSVRSLHVRGLGCCKVLHVWQSGVPRTGDLGWGKVKKKKKKKKTSNDESDVGRARA